jgi:hypothetical protein
MLKRLILPVALFLAYQLSAVAAQWTNAPVRKLKFYKKYGDSAEIFDKTVNLTDLNQGVGYFLAHTVDNCRSNATVHGSSPQSIGSMGGRWLEWALLVALKAKSLMPAYSQAEFASVPNAFNDVLVWSKEFGPVVISCKTSLRERYKQADLEAATLRMHYPAGKFYLLTLDRDHKHIFRVRKKIKVGGIIALQSLYAEGIADELFASLKALTLSDRELKSCILQP